MVQNFFTSQLLILCITGSSGGGWVPLDTLLGIWESPLMVSTAGNVICLVFFPNFFFHNKIRKMSMCQFGTNTNFNGRYSYREINKISNSRLSISTPTTTESTPTIASFCTDGWPKWCFVFGNSQLHNAKFWQSNDSTDANIASFDGQLNKPILKKVINFQIKFSEKIRFWKTAHLSGQ